MTKTLGCVLLLGILRVAAAVQEPGAPTTAVPSAPSLQPSAAFPSAAQTHPMSPYGSGATSQPARNPDGTYTLRQSSRIVVLDVVVTDGKGNLVPDLKREDFHVTEAKETQTVLNLEAAGSHRLSPDVTINSTADLDRLAPRAPVNIILLDEFNTRFEDMAFAHYSLKKFLEKQPEKLDTPTMLVAVNLRRFSVLRDYTQDKQDLINALEHHFVMNPWQIQQGQWVSERFAAAFAALMQVAQATVGHQGHKNMIWIGRGFPSFNFANAVDSEARRFRRAGVREYAA